MPNLRTLPLVCLLAGCSLLQGCATPTPTVAAYTASDVANPQPVIQKAMQKSMQRMLHPAEAGAEPATPTQTETAPVTQKPVPKATVVARKPEPPTQTGQISPVKQTSQVSQVKTIKPGTPTSKTNQKLTPEEVEDIIRKLSVCRPH